MITSEMAMLEMSTGLSSVCAWCEHWHEAKDRNVEVDCGRLKCGGPSVGRGFPAYKGPMAGHLSEICFICGKNPDAAVDIGQKMIGVCNRMGPERTCMETLRLVLSRAQGLVVREEVVPLVNGGVPS